MCIDDGAPATFIGKLVKTSFYSPIRTIQPGDGMANDGNPELSMAVPGDGDDIVALVSVGGPRDQWFEFSIFEAIQKTTTRTQQDAVIGVAIGRSGVPIVSALDSDTRSPS